MTDTNELRKVLHRFRSQQEKAEFSVNLVPSENKLSPLAQLPLRSDYYNRYFFNDALDPGFWQFRGGQDVAEMETELTVDHLSRLARAPHVNERPISGLSAMMIAMAGLGGKPGGTVVSIDAASGGHYATASMARRLGFESATVPVVRGQVDEQRLEQVLCRHEPELIYLDLQNSRHELEVSRVADLVGRHSRQTLLHVDCSHTMGLVLGGALGNPLDAGANTMGGSTHKTFPGPHKGVLFTRTPELHQRMREAQFTMLSSHHFAETLALGLASAEFSHFGPAYAEQVIGNAQLFSKLLASEGFDVATDEDGHTTSTHQIWVKIGDAEQTDRISQSLYDHGIRVNVQVDLPGMPGPVLRLGISELTFVGGREAAVHALAREFSNARAGVRRDGSGSRRVREQCGSPFHFVDYP
uniref:L-threonine:uridine-5'-aldehyde transaldolase n=1 Tax=Amycolatopsis sp. TaxID=37632 RepID=THTA_AMYSP|nr:L-Thr:uridine-5'-aldehyde transaldolase [Amycolatopsis sp. SANK 60206]